MFTCMMLTFYVHQMYIVDFCFLICLQKKSCYIFYEMYILIMFTEQKEKKKRKNKERKIKKKNSVHPYDQVIVNLYTLDIQIFSCDLLYLHHQTTTVLP